VIKQSRSGLNRTTYECCDRSRQGFCALRVSSREKRLGQRVQIDRFALRYDQFANVLVRQNQNLQPSRTISRSFRLGRSSSAIDPESVETKRGNEAQGMSHDIAGDGNRSRHLRPGLLSTISMRAPWRRATAATRLSPSPLPGVWRLRSSR